MTARTELVNGQPTGPTTEYGWDHRNRLTSVTFRASPTGAITKQVVYTYDVFDRRIGKQVDEGGNGVFDRSELFVYDGPEVALVFTDPDGDAGTAESSLTNRYLHGPLVDQILADEQIDGLLNEVGDVYWPLVDNLGTVRDIVQHTSGVTQSVEHLRYDSFGEIELDDNAGFSHRFGYTGREFDADTGLYYYRARWYDPVTHRFISEDPIGFASDEVNLSTYVSNSPTLATDPTGLDEWAATHVGPWNKPPNPLGPANGTFKVGGEALSPWLVKQLYARFPIWLGVLSQQEKDRAAFWGCGGVMSIRANHNSAMVHLKPGARAFLNYDDAVDALVDAQKRGNALLIAVQTSRPLLKSPPSGIPTRSFSDSGTEFDPSLIDIEVDKNQSRNWAALVNSCDGPTWEWANHAAKNHDYFSDPMIISRNRSLPALPYTYYVVISGARDNSPIQRANGFPVGSEPR